MKIITRKTTLRQDINIFILLITFFVCVYIFFTCVSKEYASAIVLSDCSRTNIYDDHGRYKGYIGSDNIIYDDHGRYTGKVEEQSTKTYNDNYETSGDPDYDSLTE